jgi:N-acetylmuramoyl-L-alanine amidase
MCIPMRLVLVMLFLTLGSALRAEWEIVSVDGREYVTLSSFGEDLGLSVLAGVGPEFVLTGTTGGLVVKAASRQAIVNGVRHWLSFPTRVRGEVCLISRLDAERTLKPALQPTSVKGLRPVTTVVLDAGHGGHDRGARSAWGVEKEYALDVTNRLRKHLEKAGLRVVQTRLGDSFIPLESRPATARKHPHSIFVSIHFNSGERNPAANGLEIFALAPLGAPPTGQSLPQARDRQREPGHALESVNLVLANTIQHSLLGKMTSFDRGVKRARFVVLKQAAVPAVLIEGGFLTNAVEAARIASPAWREGYAEAIAAGILEYKKLAEQRLPPKRVVEYGKSGTVGFVPD